ncbi:MAG: M16 family metallopeptidase [Bacillota bacterium]
MKKLTSLLVITLICIFALSGQVAAVDFSQELYEELSQNKNEIPYIEIPDLQKLELDNGLTVYLMKNKRLPVVEVTGYIKGGISQETEEKAGISQFMTSMMNTGTSNYSEQEFARFKELHGLSLNLDVSRDYLSISGNALITDQAELIELLAEVLREPNFDAEYYSRIQQELYRGLAQARTRQNSLLDMHFYRRVYGDHPYSHPDNLDLRMKVLQGLTPGDLEQYYQETIGPEHTVLGFAGDFDPAKMAEVIKKELGSWEAQGNELRQPELETEPRETDRVILVDKKDATQAQIKMGYRFKGADFEDRTAFMMGNMVFGGDYFSRLMENLRSQKGYVYGIYARESYNLLGGSYYIKTEVEPEKSPEAVKAIKQEMQAIKQGTEPITEEELSKNINLYNGLFPENYQTRIRVLDRVIYHCELLDRSQDYINQFIQEYNQLEPAEVQRVFADNAYPGELTTVIVGNKDDVLPAFKEKGIEVEVIKD